MSCQICGRPSAPGAKLCTDCRAARKRAYDATITQPLMALAGAGTVSRTLSRLRRSKKSPEAKARRPAPQTKAAAEAPSPPAAAQGSAGSRPLLLWILLSIGVVLAAIAGWHLPSHAPGAPAAEGTPPPNLPAPQLGASDAGAVEAAHIKPPEPAPVAPPLPRLPPIDERELIPHLLAAAKPALPKRSAPPPKAVVRTTPAPPEVEIARAPLPAPVQAAPQPAPRVDPWQQMNEAIGRCPDGFLARIVCDQRVRLQYCEGHWGQVPQCPGGPNADHD